MGCPWILRVRLLSRHPQKRSYHKFEDEAKLLEHIEACSELCEATTETFHVGSLYTYDPDHCFDQMKMTLPVMRKIKMGLPGPEEGVALIKRLLKEMIPNGNNQRVMRTLMLMTALMLPSPRLSGLPRLEEKVTLLMKGPIQLPVPDSDGRVKRFLLTGRCPRFP